LGIALEALLLHELDGKERGELKFRLALRGAWLGGNDPQDRAKIQKTLKDVYDLRSRAVHKGMVESKRENYVTLGRGTQLCKQLILKMIEADGRIEWTTLLVGGAAP
jgi:Apea-like HEPN